MHWKAHGCLSVQSASRPQRFTVQMERRLCLLTAQAPWLLPSLAELPGEAWLGRGFPFQMRYSCSCFLSKDQSKFLKKSIYRIFSLTKAPCGCDRCLNCPTSQHQGWIRQRVWLVQAQLLERNIPAESPGAKTHLSGSSYCGASRETGL